MAWEPAFGDPVLVYPDSDEPISGRIVEDFGEFTAYGVVIDADTITEPARRFAVLTDDGALVFADTTDLAASTQIVAEE